MDATTSVANTQQNQPTTPVATDPTTTPSALTPPASTTAASGSFDNSQFEDFLKTEMGGQSAGNVSEEALFSALVQGAVTSQKGADVGKTFSDDLQKQEDSMKTADGFIPLEAATKAALKDMRTSGALTSDETDQIYSQAFAAAQLDTNTNALYDDRGGAGDATIATADFATAMKDGEDKMAQYTAGTLTADARSVDEAEAGKGTATDASKTVGGAVPTGVITPEGTKFDGSGGFLFKPVADNGGNLAVILPDALKGLVKGVTIQDADGKVLDDGHSTGYGDTGKQEKFAFSKPGGDYPKDVTVSVALMDGTTTDYKIPDPSQRYD